MMFLKRCRTALCALWIGCMSLGLIATGCAGSVDDPPADAGDEDDTGGESDAGSDADGDEDEIASIEISPESTEVVLGELITFEAEAFDESDEPIEGPELNWTSGDESIASITSESGTQAEVVGESVGTTTIDVIAADDATVSASAQLEVVEEEAPVDRIEIEPEDPSVEVGQTVELEATAFDEDDNELTGRDRQWLTDDGSIATVDDSGVVSGVAEGTATISIEIGEASASVDVSVVPENTAPEADAGQDQTVQVGDEVSLDATASSDAEDAFDDLVFGWDFVADPSGGDDAITDADSAEATFEPSEVGVYEAQVTVTDTAGAEGTDRVEITVEEVPEEDCLIISEYVEGSSNNKAVELYNCGSPDITLDDYALCLESNDADVTSGDGCTQHQPLSGTLANDDTLVLCNGQFTDPNSACDQNSNVTFFNGDDRLFIYEDDNDNGSYDHGTDTVVDAFGDLGDEPDSTIWGGVTYDRCDFTPHDGAGGFDASALYSEEPEDTFDGLGQAPNEGC